MKARGGNLFEIGFMMASLSDMLMEFMKKELSDLLKNILTWPDLIRELLKKTKI